MDNGQANNGLILYDGQAVRRKGGQIMVTFTDTSCFLCFACTVRLNAFLLYFLPPPSFLSLLFTSMFVERMEVLEYRQKFEVELISTFSMTETSRKLVFSFTYVCACVCLCEIFSQWISNEQVDRIK